jgi:hypothetical protein
MMAAVMTCIVESPQSMLTLRLTRSRAMALASDVIVA